MQAIRLAEGCEYRITNLICGMNVKKKNTFPLTRENVTNRLQNKTKLSYCKKYILKEKGGLIFMKYFRKVVLL